MYTMLLVATPFLMVRNYLQPAIAKLSRFGFELGGTEIPLVPVTALLTVLVLLILLRAYLTRARILAAVIVVLMLALGQQISDYYFADRFYDLQQNWHYIAYAIFAIMLYRDLSPRGVRPTKIILITFLLGLSFSSIDEAFQFRISLRTFDMADIAKDVWGTLMGLVLIYVGGTQPAVLLAHFKQVRQPRLRGYLENSHSLLILLSVLGLLFLCATSLLTDPGYWKLAVCLPLAAFLVFFLLFHMSQVKLVRYTLLIAALGGLLVQSYFFLRHRTERIVYNRPSLTVYKGIPILFSDAMFFPNGTFRLVPKKTYFSLRDQRFFLKQKTDIILVGSGSHGEGGRGFPQDAVSQFLYNPYTQQGTQVIVLQTPEACRVYNRLRQEGKSVLFILHNT